MTTVTEPSDRRLLMDRTPVCYSQASGMTDLASLVRCAPDARRLLRGAYAAMRGMVVPASVDDRDVEELFSSLADWSDAVALRGGLALIDRLRRRLTDFVRSGGLRFRNVGAIEAEGQRLAAESQRLAAAAICLGAIRFAVHWRLEELGAVAAQEPAGAAIEASAAPSA